MRLSFRMPKFRRASRSDGRTRLAIIGSSHIAALKLAERENLVDVSGFDICFYGGSGALFQNMTLEENRISIHHPEYALGLTDGRYKELPIDEFDAFLFHGGWFSMLPYLRSCARAGMVPNSVSDGFTTALASEIIRVRGKKMKLPVSVAKQTSSPVIVSATPFRAEKSRLFRKSISRDTDMDRFTKACHEVFAEPGLHFLAQPEETIAERIYTDNKFSVGSVRLEPTLEKEHSEEDIGHMNANYGATVLTQALPLVRQLLEKTK